MSPGWQVVRCCCCCGWVGGWGVTCGGACVCVGLGAPVMDGGVVGRGKELFGTDSRDRFLDMSDSERPWAIGGWDV